MCPEESSRSLDPRKRQIVELPAPSLQAQASRRVRVPEGGFGRKRKCFRFGLIPCSDGAAAGRSHIPPHRRRAASPRALPRARGRGSAHEYKHRNTPPPRPQDYERDTLPSAVLRVHARDDAPAVVDLQLRRERVGLRLVLLHALDELRRDLAVAHRPHHVGLVHHFIFSQ